MANRHDRIIKIAMATRWKCQCHEAAAVCVGCTINALKEEVRRKDKEIAELCAEIRKDFEEYQQRRGR